MAHVLVRLLGQPARERHPHVTITGPVGSVTLDIANPAVEHSDLGSDWVEIPRPGRQPIFERVGERLRKMRIDGILLESGGSPEFRLYALQLLANNPHGPLSVSYGSAENGVWRMVEIEAKIVNRAQGTNKATRIDVGLSFTEIGERLVGLPSSVAPAGPGSSGSAPAPAPSAGGAGPAPAGPRYHVVRRGESLSAIAASHCGNANRWPEIASANKIANPNRIYPGQRLLIPC